MPDDAFDGVFVYFIFLRHRDEMGATVMRGVGCVEIEILFKDFQALTVTGIREFPVGSDFWRFPKQIFASGQNRFFVTAFYKFIHF